MFDPARHHRRSIRLRGYDYAKAGAYFITICARDRACIFADVRADEVCLTPIGETVASCWDAIPEHFPAADLDAFVVMPNHVHGIMVLGGRTAGNEGTACRAPTAGLRTSRERFGSPVAGSVPTIVRSFKAAVTKAINDDPRRGTACRALLTERLGPLPPGRIPSLWQSNYHEHIVRNERSLNHLREYIATNPARWRDDSLNPEHPNPPALPKTRAPRP